MMDVNISVEMEKKEMIVFLITHLGHLVHGDHVSGGNLIEIFNFLPC
jgi:hypothetical protein